eukprot:TRINITY_DN10193_c0_g1_i1.p1 TRINITY_DN10193_c0_g1~~TRINITY_DN10193_c0_g1_i1.p1  ORF type:complete len:252 (+),score=42.07 TRINITY_DN10193_c0_g1_i1:87-758(+)
MTAHSAMQSLVLMSNLREECSTDAATAQALKTILLLATNASGTVEAKYRKVRKGNKKFLSDVGLFDAGLKLMHLLGFHDTGGEYLELPDGVGPDQGVLRALKEYMSTDTICTEDNSGGISASPIPTLEARDGNFTEDDYEMLLQLDEQRGVKDLKSCSKEHIASLKVSECHAPLHPCYVCLQNISKGEPIISLHCGDSFHPYCIKRWAGESKRCPICRSDLKQ